jgi:hypothetical protein
MPTGLKGLTNRTGHLHLLRPLLELGNPAKAGRNQSPRSKNLFYI